MKTLILLSILFVTGLFGANVRPIDEIMHGGNQIKAATEKLNLKIIREYGGSSDYGANSFMIQRSYRVGDPEHTNEIALLTEIRDQFATDIAERGWDVDAQQKPIRGKDDDMVRFSLGYSSKDKIGTVILKSVEVNDGWLVFIDLLEQEHMRDR